MASVLFVMKYPLHADENLKRKFDGQMDAVRSLGHEVHFIGWDQKGMWLVGAEGKVFLRKNRLTGMPGYSHTKIFFDLMEAVHEVLKHRRVDLLYLRYMPTFGNSLRSLRELKRQGGKLVVEFPTYPRMLENRRSILRRPVFVYTDRILARISPLVDMFTVIGQPCGGMVEGRPAMNIENGVDVLSLPIHQPNPQNPEVNLLGLASMMQSHGYDRVIQAMANYQGSYSVNFHLVGGSGDGALVKWKRLAEDLGLSERVFFHGPLYGEAQTAIVDACDVGIGALAMFRFGLENGMPLKLREYMARGIPFVYAAQDPLIPEDARYCLRVAHDESLLDMEEIVNFALAAKQDGEAAMDMRNYARDHMSWQRVMRAVMEALKEC